MNLKYLMELLLIFVWVIYIYCISESTASVCPDVSPTLTYHFYCFLSVFGLFGVLEVILIEGSAQYVL